MIKIGIVGLPNVGKSTLFKALTKKQVDIANYPFCTIDPNIGIVEVPDQRLGDLAQMARSAKIVPTVIEFVDIAGLVKGASMGEGLGNKFLTHIREVDAILHLVRVFQDPSIIHVSGIPQPHHDIETINTELILADLAGAQRHYEKIERNAKSGSKEALREKNALAKLIGELKKGLSVRKAAMGEQEKEILRPLNLLTSKPVLFALNVSEQELTRDWQPDAAAIPALRGEEYVIVSAKMDDKLAPLIDASYRLLDLITFLTTGEKETRAWTIKRGTKAPQAAAVIHSDFEKMFIRAEVIQWPKLLEAGSWPAARKNGWLKTEGRDYEIQDGNVVEFKI